MLNNYIKAWADRLTSIRKMRDELFNKAHACSHCTDIANSDGDYIGTYCHIKQEHLVNLTGSVCESCRNCPMFEAKWKRNERASALFFFSLGKIRKFICESVPFPSVFTQNRNNHTISHPKGLWKIVADDEYFQGRMELAAEQRNWLSDRGFILED